ncbi:MAG: hypothetical protein K0Q49_1 [Haloplasmataceae bacterium]|jgi:hypothetical protein|nr:hypothetical protein [Haloplasmataceae bacterium]
MDFKALREQILANVENYDADETKIVVTKLLDFLVDINDKRSQLEIENKQLFQDMNNKNHNFDQHKAKVDDIFEKANAEAKSIIGNAEEIANKKRNEAELQSKEIINNTINKLEVTITEVKNLDQEMKLYRSHILNIFKKTIFKFSDSKYYLIRKDDKDFNELLNFFEIDSRLQLLADENIKKLNTIKNYIEIRDSVKNKVNEPHIIRSFEEILKDNELDLNESKEITFIEKQVIENTVNKVSEKVKNEEYKEVKETEKNSKKFIDILSKYNNK